MAEQRSPSVLTAPLHGAVSVLRRVPGAGVVGRAAQETLDRVGAVSPRGRRFAVYTGAGVLGVAGVVEWPVALTGAAVAWLTQPRPAAPAVPAAPAAQAAGAEPAREPARDLGSAALRAGGTEEDGGGRQETAPPGPATAPGTPGKSGTRTPSGRAGETKSSASGGPLGPTARPDRTSL
ncbi:hypothetical protein QQY24_27435 [Streptomyces sp. TG1A-8]|uniref:hypothetical protein n=1 Tax=Streptomyces sp. TG1A-8 TaxID=3051385 RepID=UPI00265BB6F5|nr:hypothetical protein [Streptomyces sp. TG1A-8]MDO0928959.1 hypothetical protein [Streptomyces sp. TG1A-8]